MIRVRDRGLGIALSEQKEIFQKFVRGSNARREQIKGTGIGLAMVQPHRARRTTAKCASRANPIRAAPSRSGCRSRGRHESRAGGGGRTGAGIQPQAGPGDRRLPGRDGQRRRIGRAPGARRRIRSHPAGCDAAAEGRLRGRARTAARRRHHLHHHVDGESAGGGEGARAGDRRRRLHHQAVQSEGTASANQGRVATKRSGRTTSVRIGSATSKWTSRGTR